MAGFARPRVSLALQGGGAHGAFTWGVLDRLMEDDGVDVEAISGASAGAVNGAVLVQGLAKGGRGAARAELARFWEAVADSARVGPFSPHLIQEFAGLRNLDALPLAHLADGLSRVLSPYQTAPEGFHPLRPVLEGFVDEAAIRGHAGVGLWVSAANVRTGRLRLFRREEVGVEALLATSCLPSMARAVEIDGEAYWDGGFVANPALFPLVEEAASEEVVLVLINPLRRADLPTTAADIRSRLQQLTLNAPLVRELDVYEQGCRCRSGGKRFSVVCAEDEMHRLGQFSKFHVAWGFLRSLRDLGRSAADRWLAARRDAARPALLAAE